ncbi:RING finger and transmembrane domain-containing protein 2 [Tribolium castaneum]|uniref:RING finger and transmembrane domain-containing protein 2-like Protein n=1 Tax=Tribolium castaneum TaxID=7070 RepID=D6WEC9_TRICA|nr:PREDICTED: RING finger and transmembrane domain-containing protein 2 [Tribolium castaneum]EEZ99887.1 RING finger and transmembrane domain-containing protein 2-like Protein [Tribolium castaneum]|eukprot:XP_968664.1 PREDICTED: RING finger and transmembrane domain-containing protein 2 [Tribolium castaneum]
MAHNSQNTHPRLLMTHTSSLPNFQRRTADSARQLRDNFNNVIREIQPLVETARTVNAGVQNAISMTNFLHRPPEQANTSQDNSFVIDLDVQQEPPNEQNPDVGRSADELNSVERAQTVVEMQQFFQVVLKYVPFVLILLAKAVYDYHDSIFILVILFTTFAHTNSAVKKETTKRDRRSLATLAIELLYIFVCSVFVLYIFEDELDHFDVVFHLFLIRTFTEPLTVGKLLWIVTITDFALKLVTVAIKILLTMLPEKIAPFQKRGKVYLFIEAISQMYRSIATIQPWLHYLLESYQGPEKVVAVFLSAFYMISKGTDLMSRMKLLKTAFFKLLQNVTVGSSPSKEQIQTAGDHCPICHDNYDSPVLLQCRHIFCENCVTTWFDREQTCPLCRAKIVDDPSWRDGSTSYFIQLY